MKSYTASVVGCSGNHLAKVMIRGPADYLFNASHFYFFIQLTTRVASGLVDIQHYMALSP